MNWAKPADVSVRLVWSGSWTVFVLLLLWDLLAGGLGSTVGCLSPKWKTPGPKPAEQQQLHMMVTVWDPQLGFKTGFQNLGVSRNLDKWHGKPYLRQAVALHHAAPSSCRTSECFAAEGLVCFGGNISDHTNINNSALSRWKQNRCAFIHVPRSLCWHGKLLLRHVSADAFKRLQLQERRAEGHGGLSINSICRYFSPGKI